MHYACLIFSDEFPTDDVIAKALEPYNDEIAYNSNPQPDLSWDWYAVGGRYSGRIKLRIDINDDEYEWKYLKNDRTNRLFRSKLLEDMKKLAKLNGYMGELSHREENYFVEMGYLDGYVRVDGCKTAHILNADDLECYYMIDKFGNASARESWDGQHFHEYDLFDDAVKKAMKNSEYVCCVDIHD